MSRVRRVAGVVTLALSLTAMTVAVQATAPPPPPKMFTISGDVAGLYPGSQKPLRLTITNKATAPIYVFYIRVDSVSVNRSGCPASSVWSPDYLGSTRIPRLGTGTVTIPVFMRSSAPNACQGATYTIRYTGSATQ